MLHLIEASPKIYTIVIRDGDAHIDSHVINRIGINVVPIVMHAPLITAIATILEYTTDWIANIIYDALD
jgi:hypothetical protein